MSDAATNLMDAAPHTWREGVRPNPTRAQLALRAAAIRYAAAKTALDSHTGPRAGCAYAALVGAFREAEDALDRAAQGMVA